MSDTTRNEQTAPLVWTNALMFALTFAAAAILVPWYGLTRGFSPAAWVAAVLFAGANGMAVTAGLYPLWGPPPHPAPPGGPPLVPVFGPHARPNNLLPWV